MDFGIFKLLELSVQALVICQKGVYLSQRAENECIVVALYQLDEYYAEVYYRCSSSEIIKIISFHCTVLLDPYLMRINIGGLFDAAALVNKPFK